MGKRKIRTADAASVLAAVQRHGSDATDLRDAAHEACHAIEAHVPRGKWNRDTIHRMLTAGCGPGHWMRFEIEARAVEQLVCRQLGVDPGSVEEWASVCWWETAKNMHINLPNVEFVTSAVKRAMKERTVKAKADAVIALGTETP